MSEKKKAEIIEYQGDGGVLARPTADTDEIRSGLEQLRSNGWNIMAPKTFVQGQGDYEYAIKALKFDPDRDFYPTGNGLAPHKNALNQIAAAAGIEWVDVERLDDFSDPHLAACKAIANAPDPATGQIRRYVDQYVLDLREGSPRAEDLSSGMLQSKRTHISALAATGAKLRVVREATGMRMDYQKHELSKPFAVVSVVSRPDRAQKGRQLAEAEEAAGELYAADPSLDPDNANDVDFDNEIDISPSADEPDGYPTVAEWAELDHDRQIDLVVQARDETGFDLQAALQDTNQAGCPIEHLPHDWLRSLYERLLDELDQTEDHEEPPF